MIDVVHELGVITRAQSSHIHTLVDELNHVASDSDLYGYLDKNLERAVLVRDLLIGLIESLVNLEEA